MKKAVGSRFAAAGLSGFKFRASTEYTKKPRVASSRLPWACLFHAFSVLAYGHRLIARLCVRQRRLPLGLFLLTACCLLSLLLNAHRGVTYAGAPARIVNSVPRPRSKSLGPWA